MIVEDPIVEGHFEFFDAEHEYSVLSNNPEKNNEIEYSVI
jgi:hypothetical protein